MHLSNRRLAMLGMLLISGFGLSTTQKACANATAQPFTCGNGISALIESPQGVDRRYTVGKTGKVVEVISFGGDDSQGGMDVRNLRNPNRFSGLSVYVKESLGRIREQVNTQFCFTDKDGDFTITRQLKDYQFESAKDGWNRASVYTVELPPRASGATLKRYSLIFQSGPRSAVIRFGDVVLADDDVNQLLTDNEGCTGTKPCN
ncbi:MAG TPA: hypothetical protein V6C89_18225 [Drouetiella sp.]|jgi:hypothetical protein